MNSIEMLGNHGLYRCDDNSLVAFSVGASAPLEQSFQSAMGNTPVDPQRNFMRLADGYNVAARGAGNKQCEDIERVIKGNRLLPKLMQKQSAILYGKGPMLYREEVNGNNEIVRKWEFNSAFTSWLESWEQLGAGCSAKEFAMHCIRSYYFFSDYFAKYRLTNGSVLGKTKFAFIEPVETKLCRLATRKDPGVDIVEYKDFRFVVVGNYMLGANRMSVYPKLNLSEVDNYKYACVGHHAAYSVGEFYGLNETYEGTKDWLLGSNASPRFINSFLRNSLAAKMHIIIPNAWIESKRTQIMNLCNENKSRKANKLELLTYNKMEIGTEFSESYILKLISSEMQKMSQYLSGEDNQGKAFSSLSFNNHKGEEERWRIETIDMKYKEYISSLIDYDKRADEVLLSAVGMDSSISSVSKDGVISKSGADVYYNYLIYLNMIHPDEEVCTAPFNMALRVNFPELYNNGYRVGFYRNMPQRQEDTSSKDRLQNKQV